MCNPGYDMVNWLQAVQKSCNVVESEMCDMRNPGYEVENVNLVKFWV
jgi:hypothetical protein